MPSQILDQFGKPASYHVSAFGGTGGALYPERDARTTPAHPDCFGDFSTLLPRYPWRRAVSDCRWIASAFPLVAGAIEQKADYVSASEWHTYFDGRDTDFGLAAEDLFANSADAICTSRSPLFDWCNLWWAGITLLDADGSFFIYLGQNEDAYPILQPLEAHRIGSWETGEQIVTGGPYDGAKILNGIIYDRKGQEIAYRVLGYERGDFKDISARDLIHVTGRARYFSQNRPLPRIAPALKDLYSILDTREAEQIAQNANSRLTFVENNETGKRNPGADLVNPQPKTAAGTDTEIVDKGYWRYVKNGGNLKAHESNRPSDQWDRFDSKITGTGLYGMGWRIEMLSLAGLNGPGVHGFADQINTTIYQTFKGPSRAVRRCRGYQCSKFIQRGDLPESADWYKWAVQEPGDFTPNPSRAQNADIEAVRSGAMPMPELHRRWNKRPEEVLRSQAKYIQLRDQIAAEYKIKNPADLGTLAKPGDAPAPGAEDETLDDDGNPIDIENEEKLSNIEHAKATADAYGVAVRAGAITPSEIDEEFMRAQLGLPAIPPPVRDAWKKDEAPAARSRSPRRRVPRPLPASVPPLPPKPRNNHP